MIALAQQWLDIQVQSIPGVEQALLLVPAGGKLTPAARWPADDEAALGLLPVATLAVEKSVAITLPDNDSSSASMPVAELYAMPVIADDEVVAVVALRCRHREASAQRAVLEALKVGSHWLAMPRPATEQTARRYTNIVGCAANCVGQDTAAKSIAALLADLGNEYRCERVCFGFIKSGHAEVAAVSNAASIDGRNEFMRKIGAAMEEAASQVEVICYPDEAAENVGIVRAHRELSHHSAASYILSVPLVFGNAVVAVVTLERTTEPSFKPAEIAACSQLLALVAPYIHLKREDERFWLQKNIDNWRGMFAGLFGYRYVGVKLATVALLVLLAVAGLYETEYRVTAKAVLEGKVQRVISAPMDGFLKSATVRAGDTVAEGALMAEMDEQDIQLQQASLNSQLEQLQRERRESMANRQLVEMRLASARIEQISAELALNRELLERVRIKAPFDGVVIEGDLSQLLGAPVARGDMLFKLAPLKGYRVILEVDESDVAQIDTGNQGTIILAAIPEQPIAMEVRSVTAAAQAVDGRNVFRVEATLNDAPARLRPGMEGVGKVVIGRRSLLWIWTHELRDWLQLQAWRWLP